MAPGATVTPVHISGVIDTLGGQGIFRHAFCGSVYDSKRGQVTFRIAASQRARKKISRVMVTVGASGYRVDFYAARLGDRAKLIASVPDVAPRELRALVEGITGLSLSADRIGETRKEWLI